MVDPDYWNLQCESAMSEWMDFQAVMKCQPQHFQILQVPKAIVIAIGPEPYYPLNWERICILVINLVQRTVVCSNPHRPIWFINWDYGCRSRRVWLFNKVISVHIVHFIVHILFFFAMWPSWWDLYRLLIWIPHLISWATVLVYPTSWHSRYTVLPKYVYLTLFLLGLTGQESH